MKKIIIITLIIVLYPLRPAVALAPKSISQIDDDNPWEAHDVSIVKPYLQDAARQIDQFLKDRDFTMRLRRFKEYLTIFQARFNSDDISDKDIEKLKTLYNTLRINIINDGLTNIVEQKHKEKYIKNKKVQGLSVLDDILDKFRKAIMLLSDCLELLLDIFDDEDLSAIPPRFKRLMISISRFEICLVLLGDIIDWGSVSKDFLDSLSESRSEPVETYAIIYFLQQFEENETFRQRTVKRSL